MQIFAAGINTHNEAARITNIGGAGLGLSIAKWIVEARGGTIEVKSTPNVQTVFTVKLPMKQQTFPFVSEDGQSYSSIALQKLGLSRRKLTTESVVEGR